MKSINRKLLASTGLFVAFCALTSFNPFSQANHLSYLNKEGNATFASNVNVPAAGKPAQRDVGAGKPNAALAARMTQLQGATPQTLEERAAANGAAKPNTDEANRARGSQSSDKEGTVCVDGKCESSARNSSTEDFEAILAKVEKNEKLSAAEIAILRDSKGKDESLDIEDEEIADTTLCADGDYMDRIVCLKKMNSAISKKRSKATSEQRGNLKEEIEEFIVEIVTDDSLDTREKTKYLNKVARIVKGDTSLSSDVRLALQSMDVSRQEEIFARRIESRTAEIQAIDNQIRQINASGMAQYSTFQLDTLYTQRKSLIYGLEEEIKGFRDSISVSLPQARVGGTESALVAHLRTQRAASYQSLITPVAGALTDKTLTSLDTNLGGAPVLAGAPTVSGPQPFNTGLNSGGLNSGLNSGGLNSGLNSYNPANPLAGLTGQQGSGPIPYSQYIAMRGGQNFGTAGYTPYGAGNQYSAMNGQQGGPTPFQGRRF